MSHPPWVTSHVKKITARLLREFSLMERMLGRLRAWLCRGLCRLGVLREVRVPARRLGGPRRLAVGRFGGEVGTFHLALGSEKSLLLPVFMFVCSFVSVFS